MIGYRIAEWIIVAGLFCCGCTNGQRSVSEAWSLYLDDPDEENYAALTARISSLSSDCDWGSPANEQVFPSNVHHELFGRISSGGDEAFRLGLVVRQCLDGGDLGDFYRSAGVYLDLKPEEFLRALENADIEADVFRLMVIALPEVLVDDLPGQIRATVSRAETLERIPPGQFDELRIAGVRYLRTQEQRLRFVNGQGAQ